MTTTFPSSTQSFIRPATDEQQDDGDSKRFTTLLDDVLDTLEAVQDEVIALLGSSGTINDQTGTEYTAVIGDRNGVVTMDNAAANDFIVPPNSSVAFPVGSTLEVWQKGAGETSIVAGSGVTILYPSSLSLTLREQESGCTLRKFDTNTWRIVGNLAPSGGTPPSTAFGEVSDGYLVTDVFALTDVTTAAQVRTLDLANGSLQSLSANQNFTLNAAGPAGKSGWILLSLYTSSASNITFPLGSGFAYGSGTAIGGTALNSRTFAFFWDGTRMWLPTLNISSLGDLRPT